MYSARPILVLPTVTCSNINEARLFNEGVPLGAVATVVVIARG
jgi:hypothetical protein